MLDVGEGQSERVKRGFAAPRKVLVFDFLVGKDFRSLRRIHNGISDILIDLHERSFKLSIPASICGCVVSNHHDYVEFCLTIQPRISFGDREKITDRP